MLKYSIKDYINVLEKENQIIDIIDCEKIYKEKIELLSYNSTEVEENTLFVCKGFGNNFKEEYLRDAKKYGAIAYVSEKKYDIDLPCIIVKDAFASLSILGNLYYNEPAEDMNVIGITGTKGKSTTAYYIKYILDEYSRATLKNDIAIISSIDTYDGVEKFESHITTPESLDIYKHLHNAKESNIDSLVMEVSSQSLKIGRVHSLKFDIGLFLNISEDHISQIEHSDFEDYFSSKLKIFANTDVACINMDSDMFDRIRDTANNDSKKVITFSCKNIEADIFAYNIRKDGFNTVFNVRTPSYDREFVLTMPGLFNVENALAAISVAYVMEIPDKYIYVGLEKARSSGRMEVYHSKDEKIITLVDYAHNKLSFEKLYESTKSEYPDRKIVTVFGCPGKKSYLRRRYLGLLAGENSDMIYLTAEDPGYEPVEDISKEIAKYVEEYTKNYEMIEDRGEAIKAAVEYAKKQEGKTIILITGKGNETRQKIGSEYVPCKTDVEYSLEYLREYDKMMEESK